MPIGIYFFALFCKNMPFGIYKNLVIHDKLYMDNVFIFGKAACRFLYHPHKADKEVRRTPMVKKVLLVLILAVIIAGAPVMAQEGPINFHLNFMNLGGGIYLPLKGTHMAELSFELLNFGIEFTGTGFGVSFSPFNFLAWGGETGKSIIDEEGVNNPLAFDAGFSFVNLYAYWNLLGFLNIDKQFYVGPFAGLNCVFMGLQEFQPGKYVFSAGLQGGYRGVGEKIHYNIFSIDIGFRSVEGDSKFFVGVKVELLMPYLKKKGII
jgi:hypothetical protein